MIAPSLGLVKYIFSSVLCTELVIIAPLVLIFDKKFKLNISYQNEQN